MKVDWARKLTSRKMWLAISSFCSMMVVAQGGTESTATKIAALIMAGATMIGYIIGEGLTDAANKPSGSDDASDTDDDAP